MIDSLLPVGRDCDCGFPLVWSGGHQRCAVYGSHPGPSAAPVALELRDPTSPRYVVYAAFPADEDAERRVHLRNINAPGARLVDELTALGGDRTRARPPKLKAVS